MEPFRTSPWGDSDGTPVVSPADRRDTVGAVRTATPADIDHALDQALRAQPRWDATPAAERAEALLETATAFESHRAELPALLVREGGNAELLELPP